MEKAFGPWMVLVVFMSFFSPLLSSSSWAEDRTPVQLDPLRGQKILTESREWRAPRFEDQSGATGWSAETFDVPRGMEKQVKFWVDVYTQYSTYQGIIHDTENMDLVYEVIDFRDVEKSDFPASMRDRLKRKMVEEAKERAVARLEKVSRARGISDLNAAERRLWHYFRDIDGRDKFQAAMSPARMRFQLGQKDRMESAIFLSGRYLEDFEKIFREQNLPIELTRLVFVESSFNVLARSKVGASGLWQLMPGTVRPFRVMTSAVDGRNHPMTATKIAAQFLGENYRKLRSWPLAITGYNHGPAGVAKIVDKYETRDISELIRNVRSRASFGFASRNFYASFLAALEVERNASKYFPNVAWSEPLPSEEIVLPQTIKYGDLANWFRNDDERLQIFNPHLTSKVKRGQSIPVGTRVLLPKDRVRLALSSLGAGKTSRSTAAIESSTKSRRSVSGATKKKAPDLRTHRVTRGENLTMIARRYGLAVNDLQAANDLNENQPITPGQKLRLPK